MRGYSQMAALLYKPERVEPFVTAHGQRLRAGKSPIMTSAASRSAVPFAWKTSRPRSVRCDSPPPDSRCNSTSTFSSAFARQQRVGIGLGRVGFVGALLPVKVHAGIARIIRRWSRLVLFWLKAFQTRPGFQQRAVHREMSVAGQPLRPRLLDHARQKLLGHVGLQRRSRFLVKVVASQTSSSAFSPTNQRNSRL